MPSASQEASDSGAGHLPDRLRLNAQSFLERIAFQRLTIWIDPGKLTPSEKYLRIDYDSAGGAVSGLPAALFSLGLMAPSFIGPGEIVWIDHDLLHSRIYLRAKPGDALAIQ